jgi:hypothetical protein
MQLIAGHLENDYPGYLKSQPSLLSVGALIFPVGEHISLMVILNLEQEIANMGVKSADPKRG